MYDDDSRTVTELKDAIFGELGPDSQMVDRAITDLGTVRLLAATLRKRTQMGPFTLNVTDGKPRAGTADDIVNLLCYFIGNRMIPRFCRCDIKHNTIKQNMSMILT